MEITNIEERLIGVVGVDSGQLILSDPCYIDSEWRKRTKFDHSDKFKGEFSYNGCCNATLKEEQAGQLHYRLGHDGAGVVFSSGIGDGTYNVYATYGDMPGWGRRIISVRIALSDHPFIKQDEGCIYDHDHTANGGSDCEFHD
jgi:hypothetical protein